MVGIWPLTASKPQKCKNFANFLQFLANLTSPMDYTWPQDLKKVYFYLIKDEEDENENEEENHENEVELYDKETADIKSRDFLTKNLEHLDEMEMDIKKSRKNLRVKFQRYSNKMEAEIKNFNLLSCSFTMHQLCVHEIWELKDFLTKPETKSDKEEIIKVINKCRSRYRLLLNNMN